MWQNFAKCSKLWQRTLATHVRVVNRSDPLRLEDGFVICPRRIGEVNLLGASDAWKLVELLEENCTKMVGTSSRDGLHRADPPICDGGAVLAKYELRRTLCKVVQAGNAKVFMIEALIGKQRLLGRLDGRQHEWLAVIIPVCANAKVDLLLECVSLVRGGKLEDGVRRGLRNSFPDLGGLCIMESVVSARHDGYGSGKIGKSKIVAGLRVAGDLATRFA